MSDASYFRDASYCIGDTKDFTPCFDDIVNWSANFKVNLIGPDHGLKHSISPEKGPKHVTQKNPTLASIKPLLEEMKEPSVLLLLGCDRLLVRISDFPFHKFETITSLEISGVTHLTHFPEHTFSRMSQLQSLNLSHLPIQQLPPFIFRPLELLRSLILKGCPDMYSIPALAELGVLQYLEISHLPIEELDRLTLMNKSKLSWFILRGCSKLRRLPESLTVLDSLEVLDVSHCTVCENWEHNTFFYNRLKMLDVSYSAFNPESLTFYKNTLTHLFLRDTKVNHIRGYYNNLQVLDLSGAQNVRKMDWLQTNEHLVALDLSRTDIETIDFLSDMIHLRNLILRRCTGLVQLPAMNNLTNLEVLDISGCETLDDLPEDLSNLANLKELNLSGCSCLQQLRDCLFDRMSSLEKLDLSKTEFNHFPSFSNLTNLQILNLSQTSMSEVLNVSELVNLKELLLANCQRLQVLPDVRALTKLETLDLSLPDDYTINHFQVEAESHSQRGQFFSDPSRLQKLVLANRPGVLELFPEVSPENLQYLDLRGRDVIGVCSSRKGNLQEAVDIHPSIVQRKISKCDEIHLVSTFLSMSSGCDRFRYKFCELEKQILKIQTKIKFAATNNNATEGDITCNGSNKGNIQSEVFKRQYGSIGDDLKYIKKKISLLESSDSCKRSDKFLHEVLDVATHLSEGDSPLDPLDYTKLNELLRIVSKLKILVPPGQKETNDEPSPKSVWDDYELDIDLVLDDEEIQETYDSLEEIERNCLFYFSNFPSAKTNDLKENLKHSSIQKRILIQWWISDGLIGDPHHEENSNSTPNRVPQHASAAKGVEKVETIEEIGKQILKVLEEKKLIVPLIFNFNKSTASVSMLPSVHSFVTKRAVEEGFFDNFLHENDKLPPHLSGSKRVCLLKSQDNYPSSCRLWASYANSSEKLERFKTIRALFNINETMIDIKAEWFSKMRNLLVLHLGNLGCEEAEHIEVTDLKFLEELKNMKHLRLLSLEGFPTLTKLPDSVCELSNLKILNLRDCGYLDELPAGIGSLKNLTHLDLTDSRILSMLPKGISLLSKLEVLKGFVIYYQEGGQQHRKACALRDLLKLKNLRKLNLVVNRDKFPDSSDLQVLKSMEKLCNLRITWEKNFDTVQDRADVVGPEALKQSRWQQLKCWEQHEEPLRSNNLGDLRKLVLCCFPLETVPDWLDPSEMRNLKRLYIIGGNLRTLLSETNHNTWNVENLRFMYLKAFSIEWEDLRRIFSNMRCLYDNECRVCHCPEAFYWTEMDK